MGDYWQDKRVSNRQVAAAWGLALAVAAVMLAVSFLAA